MGFSTRVPATSSHGRLSSSRTWITSFSVAVPGVGWSRTRLGGTFPSRRKRSATVALAGSGRRDRTDLGLGLIFQSRVVAIARASGSDFDLVRRGEAAVLIIRRGAALVAARAEPHAAGSLPCRPGFQRR